MTRRILCPVTLSARNRLEGKIDEMKLKVGDVVSAIIKSTEVMLEKD